MAANLYVLYENEINLLYLIFLKPILSSLQNLNKSFQSQSADPTKLLSDMEMCMNYLKQFVINPTADVDIFSTEFENHVFYDCYLGYTFETRLSELRNDMQISEESENQLRNTCVTFVVYLMTQLKTRYIFKCFKLCPYYCNFFSFKVTKQF